MSFAATTDLPFACTVLLLEGIAVNVQPDFLGPGEYSGMLQTDQGPKVCHFSGGDVLALLP